MFRILIFIFIWQVITVQAVINNVNKTFTLNNLSSVRGAQLQILFINFISPSILRSGSGRTSARRGWRT